MTYEIGRSYDEIYISVRRVCIDDSNLSLRALGLLVYLLSFQPDFQCSCDCIAKNRNMNKGTVEVILKELMKAGYVKRAYFKNEKNLKRCRLIFCELPKFKEPNLYSKYLTKTLVDCT